MSDHEKPQETYVYGYTTTRPGQELNYAGSIQAPFNSPYPASQASESHALVTPHQMPYLGPSFESRDTGYHPNPVSLVGARTRSSPEVTSTGPFSGRANDLFHISIRSKIDYTARPFTFTILFGNIATSASISKTFFREPFYHYTLETVIPPISKPAQAQNSTMPLLLDVQDENGQSLSMKSLDNFSYLESSPFSRYAAPLEVQKKRKYADESPKTTHFSAKRFASTPHHQRSETSFSPLTVSSAYNFESGGLYAMPTLYDRPNSQRSYIPPAVQRTSTTVSTSPPLPNIKERSLSSGSFATYTTMGRSISSQGMTGTPQVPRAQSGRSSSMTSNPPLIRTSILQPQPSSSYRTPGFNPYTIAAKAKLEIQGDLMLMASISEWTDEEKKIQRRLVEFHRRQEDSVIHASFKAVSAEERTQGANCVSCIYWEERGECFVTSVDTIQLLEGLVGVRFTVEEKNRIRRNLEGFKPLTVSKQKEDSESFFRLIMGFPSPKPRNIEKDVKVFPWAILSSALRKIIGKYSASYASTSAILTPSTAAHLVSSMAEQPIEHLMAASPQSSTSSAASRGYSAGMTMTALPADHPSRMAIEATASTYDHSRQIVQPMSTISQWTTQYSSAPPQYSMGHGAHPNMATFSDPHQVHYYANSNPTEHAQAVEYPSHSQAHTRTNLTGL